MSEAFWADTFSGSRVSAAGGQGVSPAGLKHTDLFRPPTGAEPKSQTVRYICTVTRLSLVA